ncbi:MAG: SDR family NAD(P)-dependent oxidoreductase, partial [Chloroflexota bacterium]
MKSVFVTGTTSGIGLYTARHMHALGWQVFAGVYPGEDTTKLTEGINDSARLHVVDIDITNAEMVATAQAKIAQHTDKLHGLVNNAGISVSGPLEVLPLDDIRRQMEVNVIGQIAVTQAMMPMIRTATGRIVNVASILGRLVAPFSGPYCASKFALEAVTD